MAVLDPVKLVITNWDELMGAEHLDPCSAPVHPHLPELGRRDFQFGKEVWIERNDFEEVPPKGYKRLFPGNKVRLKDGYVIECTGAVKDADGTVTEVHATVVPDTKSGTPGADAVKVKAVITWVGVADGVPAEVRLYDRLFTEAQPDAGGKDFIESLNPDSLKVVTGVSWSRHWPAPRPTTSSSLSGTATLWPTAWTTRRDKPVFNRVTGLKDSWGR